MGVLLAVAMAAMPAAPAGAAVVQPTGNATATVETAPVLSTGDAADDPAIWVNAADPARSAVIGNDKGGSLEVYDLAGTRIQRITEGFFGNVDVRHAVPTGAGTVDVVGVYRLGLRFYRIDPATRTLSNITDDPTGSIKAPFSGEGFCLYHSPSTGRLSAFVDARDGRIAQFELGDTDGDGLIDGRLVRSWDVGTEVEGCVADDGLGDLYVSEEGVGIWKYGAEPTAGTTPADRVLVDSVTTSGGRLVPDIEGLTIVYQPNGTGYLMASSQAASNTANFYAVYERQGANAFVRTFRVVNGATVDGCGRTDGIDAVAQNMGPAFPNGMFVCQDNNNSVPGVSGNQNFKFVPLERVVGLNQQPPANTPPTARFTSSCAGLSCTLDGSGSSDAEGAIASYHWDFGDGSTGSGVRPAHAYGAAGTYQVTLTVTDSAGATGAVTHPVVAGSVAGAIAFRGEASTVVNGTAPGVTVPAAVQAGDGLLLYATLNITTTTVTAPAGWTQVANFVTASARTLVWKKAAAPGDAGSRVALGLSATTKVALQLAAYGGTAANPVVATRSDTANTLGHPTPVVTVPAGGWVVSYWADKSATTTAWTAPAGVTVRAEPLGTGGGRITSLLADSGGAVPAGTAGGLTATTDAPSRAASVTIALAPA
ncbi:MAG TPA: phytase [Mycobacteriales bacterium]|nr:phytase [Mycobacteriales bacterium]